MEVNPPPLPGSRIQELGDGLAVRFRPPRAWGELVLFAFWLFGWTLGGVAVFFALGDAGWGGRAFLIFWLCGWCYGEFSAIVGLARLLDGREELTVTREELVMRMRIGRFTRMQRYQTELVDDVRSGRVDVDDKRRTDYCLLISHNGDTVRVGGGMGEREAAYVASAVQARIRPRAYVEPRDAPEPITAPEPLTAEEWTRRHGHGWFLIRRDPEFEGEHVEYGESIRRFVLSRTTMTD